MKRLNEVLLAALLALLCIGTCIVVVHLPYWCKSVTLTLAHVDQFAGRGARAMGKLETAADTSIAASAETLERIRELRPAIAAATETLNRAGAAITSANATFARLEAHAEPLFPAAADVLNRSSDLLTTANTQLPPIGDLLRSGRKLVDDSDALIAGPTFADFLAGATLTSSNAAKISTDLYQWGHKALFPPKATGKMRFIVNTGRVAAGAARLVIPPAQARYYLTNSR